MFTSDKKKKYLLSSEEKEIVRLESLVSELSSDLSTEKEKNSAVATQADNKKPHYISQGRKLERERLLSITHLPEFAGREDIALKMALSNATGSTASEIGIMLRSTPKNEVEENQFVKMMNSIKNPEIRAGHDSEYGAENNPLELIAKGSI